MNRKLKISLVLPFPVTKPVGGARVMYEYANRLQLRGHQLTIYHSIKRPYKKSNTPLLFKRLVFALRNVQRPKWFALAAGIQSKIVPEITAQYLQDADVVMGTWWQMAYAIAQLPDCKGKKFNLIQDFETWKGNVDLVKGSYQLPLHHIVIASYLQKLVGEISTIKPTHVPNAIDTNIFNIKIPVADRNPHSVIMLYSQELRKGTKYGIEALEKLKSAFPQLKAILFGVYPKPENLPSWMEYHHKPSDLCSLYNSAAIFISPSLGEGWALPPAEAMACGCAVVCTNIGGHADYAFNEQTAWVVEPENSRSLADAVDRLLNNKSKRIHLAEQGAALMHTQFSWDYSVSALESCFLNAIKE